MLGLATLRASDERGAEHGVNVMILAVATGCALEMEAADLTSLAVSALLHDIGKTVGPSSDDGAIGDPAGDGHPAAGAQLLADLVTDDPRPMLVAWEHHMGVDGSGWPQRSADHEPHPFSLIVAIADRYERLTSGQGERAPLTPDASLAEILAHAGNTFDPVLARLFARTVGVYPAGTVVLLNDSRVAVVRGAGRNPAEPVVSVIADAGGSRCAVTAPLDLAGTGLRVSAVLDADLVDIDATDYL
jgi:HD-GYP domain-containing protein (c-di-GMP phosphodiesterase class II)